MAKLVVVIISWNTCDLTRNCLQTLFPELEGTDNEVWVVDNASTDDSVRMIKEEFSQVRLLENKENVGFARANNQVLKYADGEYCLLLNSDTIIPKGAIQGLCRFMDEHPEAGAAGPKLKNGMGIPEKAPKPMPTLAGEFRYCLANHFFPFNNLFRSLFGRRKQYRIQPLIPVEAEVLSAACLIIRQEVV